MRQQKDLKKISEFPLDSDFFHKTAIENAHAVIINDPEVSQELIEFIKNSGKPVLMAQDMTLNADIYNDFYSSI